MKRTLFSLICLLALIAASSRGAGAQDDSQQSPTARHWPTPEEVVARMDQKLSLSDDQKAKISPIIADRQDKMKALAESSGRRRAKRREMQSIILDSDKKIEALLTDDQKKKYEQMEQERREQAREHRAERQGDSPQ